MLFLIAMKIHVRQAEATDAPELAELITELGYPAESQEIWSRIKKMPKETYETLVAVGENKVIGFIGLLTLPVYEHSQPIGWVLALCVSPRSQRKGVGKALIQAAEAYYQDRGVTDIRLHSGSQREDAHEFYEAMGFSKSGYRFKKKI
jgi:ribosomal protein S18 acetylase RimI-like enzyme